MPSDRPGFDIEAYLFFFPPMNELINIGEAEFRFTTNCDVYSQTEWSQLLNVNWV